MGGIDEDGVLVGEVVFLLVTAVHGVRRDGRVCRVAADDVNVGVVLQTEHEGIVQIVVASTSAGRRVVVDVRRRGYHNVLSARLVLGYYLVGHQVCTSTSVVSGVVGGAVGGHRIICDIHHNGLVRGDCGAAEMVGAQLRIRGQAVNLSFLQSDRERDIGCVRAAGIRRCDGHRRVVLRRDDFHAVLRLRITPAARAVAVVILILHRDEELRSQTVRPLQSVNFAVVLFQRHVGVYMGSGMDIESIIRSGVVITQKIVQRGLVLNEDLGSGRVGRNRERGHGGVVVCLFHRNRCRFVECGDHQRDRPVCMVTQFRYREPKGRIDLRVARKGPAQQYQCTNDSLERSCKV